MDNNEKTCSLFAKSITAAALPINVMGFIGETICEMITNGSMNKAMLVYCLEDKLAYLDPEKDFYKIALIRNSLQKLNNLGQKKR